MFPRSVAPSRLMLRSIWLILALAACDIHGVFVNRSTFIHKPSKRLGAPLHLDPASDEAREITSRRGLSDTQHDNLIQLTSLVVEWNQRINLVSRKDCREDVVFERHVLPCISVEIPDEAKVIDVGTGGGFPGLPLAICYPNSSFLLVDSVGKKLKAVKAMADELNLQNVNVHHGRAEEMVDDDDTHLNAYDVCLGRSVAALPTFCFWIQDLLQKETGKLLYIIGGEVDESILQQASQDIPLDYSDKRILVLEQSAVTKIAATSGETKRTRGKSRRRQPTTTTRGNRKAKGQWTKRDNKVPKQRGYDDFKRYN